MNKQHKDDKPVKPETVEIAKEHFDHVVKVMQEILALADRHPVTLAPESGLRDRLVDALGKITAKA